ncbi:PAS fold family [Synechococcus sp. PCC 7335]|uniref:chemotaxis protein CheB n=1 Tax=Synechococcus sp. (strain ATCC 29403 / PCC 7335) TaxID=91464 RepID=UPI00017EDD0E|nr:chemotaxis protein CheB [Synechococcus sp. PCC 7335]EDX85138.1 PAS fold family [Synechococcus sp. PCC 7335]
MASDPSTGSPSSNNEEPQENSLLHEPNATECDNQAHTQQLTDDLTDNKQTNDQQANDQQTERVAEEEIQSAASTPGENTLAETEITAQTASVTPIEATPKIDSFLTVGIGASAGGLEAFRAFFQRMDENSGMAFVLISHLAPDHDSLLSELLAKETQMPVLQITEEVRLQPNKVYVIPPNATLTVDNGILRLSTPTQARGHRAPIDIFFRSLAEDQRENAVCVILSGTGSDGTIGMKSIKEFGGLAIAQDSESAKYDSMPRNAVLTGLVDYVLPVKDIPDKLIEYARHREGLRANLGEDGMLPEAADYLNQICSLVRRRIGHDFSNYKQGTLIRRIQRRIQITQTVSVEAYVAYLKSDNEEIDLLFKDLLIGVTYFFRDPEAFEVLQQTAITTLVQDCADRKSIRVWVAGCSSGEEVYSIAILLAEEMERQRTQLQVQIFATDIDEQALEKARHARYPESIAEQITPERLERFFLKQDGLYQVAKPLREMCIFSQHSLISDPPFSRLDLISCRNLLIYFDSTLQKRLMPLFHYALRESGYLFLGGSENLSTYYSELFRIANKSHRLFQRRTAIAPPQIDFPLVDLSSYRQLPAPRTQTTASRHSRFTKSIEQVLLQDYTPACVIINEQNEIVYFFGRTGKYLEPAQGVPSNNLFDVARLGLRTGLRSAIQTARDLQRKVVREQVSIESENQIITLNLIIRPVKESFEESAEASRLLLVIFQDVGKPTTYETARASDRQPKAEAPIIKQLEDELRVTKEDLRQTVEGIETSNEELKSANEELLSMNEELQSSNEELQTSKEEMQSINEELETVNTELRNKVEELDTANSDIQNLFESTRIATVFLDERLRIKRFTPAAVDLFNLIGTDVGRPVTDISLSLEGVSIATDVREVLRSLIPIEREVYDRGKGIYYKMRIMPYRTLENVINGTVLTFIDVTGLHQARNRAERWAQRQSVIAELGTYALQDHSAASVCDRATEIVCQTLESDTCGLFAYQSESPEILALKSGSGWPLYSQEQVTISVTDSHLGYTLSVQQPVTVEDFSQENRFSYSPLLRKLNLVSGISAILYGPADEIYGVLASYRASRNPFTPEDVSFLQALANALAATLQREATTSALEKSRERLDLATTAGNIGIWEIDIVTGGSAWNDIEYGLLGLKPNEANDPSLELYYHQIYSEDIPLVQQKVAAAIEQKTEFDTEFRISCEGSPLRWLAAKARVICDTQGNAIKMIGVNYDITERKQNEEALKEADRRKDDFLAALGHELRNPLNALSGSIELISTQISTQMKASLLEEQTRKERMQRMLAISTRQLNQLTRLVNDLLDASRIAYKKIQLHQEPLDLSQLLRDVVTDAQNAAAQKEISFNTTLYESSVWINGDSVRLLQAFSNVLLNAIKFSHPGSTVKISTTLNTEFATVRITDAGIGMSKEAFSRIFVAFSQENRSLSRSGGLGLGLPLAKGIIELHEGQIEVDSPGIDQGTVVTITLPRLKTEIAEPALPSKPESSATSATKLTEGQSQHPSIAEKSKRVLVIEDCEDSAVLLQMYLNNAGFIVDLADNGKQGIALARQLKPDVVISDIGLTAEMDGYAVAQTLRSESIFRDTFLIAISGYGQLDDKARATAAGFDEHLTKPVNLQKIRAIIMQRIFPE